VGSGRLGMEQRLAADKAGGNYGDSPRRRLKELTTAVIQPLVGDIGTANVRRSLDQHRSRSLKKGDQGAGSVPGQASLDVSVFVPVGRR
jgi:hypothetical protein